MLAILSTIECSLRRTLVEPRAVIADLLDALVAGNGRYIAEVEQRRRIKANAGNKSGIFVWIPKSAGTSVFSAFELHGAQKLLSVGEIRRYFKERGLVTFGHIYVPELVRIGVVSSAFVNQAFKFTIVRNPFDRAISLFEYLKRIRVIPKTTTFDIFCSFVGTGAWEAVGRLNHDGMNQLNPQVRWIRGPSSELLVDRVYRFEELNSAWPGIWREAGMCGDAPVLETLNKSNRMDSRKYLSRQNVRVLQSAYAEDFEMFGYSRDADNVD